MMISHFEQFSFVPESGTLSSVPYFDANLKPKHFVPHALEHEPKYRVSIFADMVKVKRVDAAPPEHGIHQREEVRGFSAKSRKRMIEALASVERVPDLFATMTYSDDVATLNPDCFRAHFEAFRRRLERAYPDLAAMWRIELQDRKSGYLKGLYVPHFHLLIWLPRDIAETEKEAILEDTGQLWRDWWHEIIESENEYHKSAYGLQLEPIRSRRHAYHYASKYVAKAECDNHAIGRRWGRIGNLDTLPVFEMEISIQQYIELKRLIAAYAKKRKVWVGRKLKRSSIQTGLTCFGLGAWNEVNKGLDSSTIWKMIDHTIELVQVKRSG